MERKSSYTLADVSLEGKGGNEYLDKLNGLINWRAIESVLAGHYKVGKALDGRPAHPPLLLFKMTLLSIWYALSDRATEQACSDRLSFMRFLGMGMADPVPDSTRLVRFRSQLGPKGMEALLAEVNRQLEARNLIVRQGVMVDATVTEAARKSVSQGGAGELEAGLARKGSGPARLAYKAHTATDAQGLVLGLITTPGNLADCQQLEHALDAAVRSSGELPFGSRVVADKGYFGKAYSRMLAGRGLKDGIMGKSQRHVKLGKRGQKRNGLLSKVRYVVERTFGSVKSWFKAGRSRYMGLAKTHFFHLAWAVSYNLKRLPGLLAAASPSFNSPLMG